MFKIRKSIFETNSSSSDYYYDDNDDNTLSNIDSYINFIVTIKLDNFDNNIKNKFLTDKKYWDELATILRDFFVNNKEIEKDTYISVYSIGKGVEFMDLEEIDENEISYNFILNVDCEVEMLSAGYYSPATYYDPPEYEPAEYNVYIPEWNTKYNAELEQLIKKSSLGEYISKITDIELDLSELESEINSCEDYGIIYTEKPSESK